MLQENDIKTTFNRLYKGSTIYAVQLDGFTHKVFYKDENGERHIEAVSAYALEICKESHKEYNAAGEFAWKAFNLDKTKILFLGYPHSSYQGSAKEYVYQPLKEW